MRAQGGHPSTCLLQSTRAAPTRGRTHQGLHPQRGAPGPLTSIDQVGCRDHQAQPVLIHQQQQLGVVQLVVRHTGGREGVNGGEGGP